MKDLKRRMILIVTIIIAVLIISFGIIALIDISSGGKTMYLTEEKLQSIDDLSAYEINKINNKIYFFGHQSVGFNIINGIEDIMNENPDLQLRIKKYSNISDFDNYNFIHATEGENTKPDTKVECFYEHITEGIGEKADIVFLKFCYVDIDNSSDVNEIFNYYKRYMDKLKEQYPDTVFVHITIPLVSQKIDIIESTKNIIKKILGRPVNEKYLSNIKRSRFNKIIHDTYDDKEPVFDLARIESMFPDGKRQYHELNGEIYYSMLPEYTQDGGHLNETGRKLVAEQLLVFLAGL